MSTKVREVTSNVFITEQNERVCQTVEIPGTQRVFLNKIPLDIDGCTNELQLWATIT